MLRHWARCRRILPCTISLEAESRLSELCQEVTVVPEPPPPFNPSTHLSRVSRGRTEISHEVTVVPWWYTDVGLLMETLRGEPE